MVTACWLYTMKRQFKAITNKKRHAEGSKARSIKLENNQKMPIAIQSNIPEEQHTRRTTKEIFIDLHHQLSPGYRTLTPLLRLLHRRYRHKE